MKNTLISALFLGTFLFPKIVKAGAIHGRVFDSHNGQTSDSTLVDVIINDGTSGTEHSKVPEWGDYGLWIVDSGNFTPQPGIGDTVKMLGELDTGTKVYTTHMRSDTLKAGESNWILPTAFLDDPDKNVRAHAFGGWCVTDTSNVNDTLRAEGWLAKNPDQKIPYINYYLKALGGDSTLVDTSDIYPELAINLEKQDSLWLPGDLGFVRIYKNIGDTVLEKIVSIPLDTLKYGCATLLDSIVFPETTYVNDQTAPEITNVTEWSDTSYTGPFDVEATITDGAGISEEWLKYKFGSADPESCNSDSTVGDIYYYTIPSMTPPDSVHYQIKAIDASQNQNVAYWPGPSQDDWWSFNVNPVGINENIEGKIKAGFRVNQHLGRNFKFSCEKYKGKEKTLRIFNSVGRLVDEILSNDGKWNLDGKNIPSGFYFAILDNKTKKIVNIK